MNGIHYDMVQRKCRNYLWDSDLTSNNTASVLRGPELPVKDGFVLELCVLVLVEALEEMVGKERLWPILTAVRSERSPGCDIWTSLTLISLVNIFTAADIRGRRPLISCTQSRPTFKNWIASSSGKSFSVGSTSCRSLLSVYISHACTSTYAHWFVLPKLPYSFPNKYRILCSCSLL